MYFFKITTPSNVIYEGLSSKIEDLNYLIDRKIELSGVKGKVEIFDGKKLIKEYEV